MSTKVESRARQRTLNTFGSQRRLHLDLFSLFCDFWGLRVEPPETEIARSGQVKFDFDSCSDNLSVNSSYWRTTNLRFVDGKLFYLSKLIENKLYSFQGLDGDKTKACRF